MQILMKQLAATFSRQRGIQYEFGPEYTEYSAKKAAGIHENSHLKPLSEIFTEEQLEKVPIDNKVGKNYFGQMSEQLRRKGGSAFSAVGDRLVLKSNKDLAFCQGAEKMLKDKELKAKREELDNIEGEWSRAQKDVIRSKLCLKDAEADILAKEQAKNKLIHQCIEHGKKFKYNSPVSSIDDVNLLFTKIQKLNEKDQLTIMRREVKLKKLMFLELPADFVLFKQFNISAKNMYENLLGLHSVESCNQEVISVEDIYEITDSLNNLPLGKKTTNSTVQATPSESLADLQWPPDEEEYVVTLEEDGWSIGSVQSYNDEQDAILVQLLTSLNTRAKDDKGKTYWIYPSEEKLDLYKRKNILDIRPSISLAKNIKRRDPVFALCNREVIEALSIQLFDMPKQS